MSDPTNKPHRQRRLDRIFDSTPSYFLTLCTEKRVRVLDNRSVFENVRRFVDGSVERYGVYVNSYVLMPDHVHLIVSVAPASEVTIGNWVKAFKAMAAQHQFKWQAGFFDHVLRSDESLSEKWEYIRMNPVRAKLVEKPDEWPYAQQFNSFDGSEL